MVSVSLKPLAATVHPVSYTHSSLKQSPSPQSTSIPIPKGYKIFVNVCFDTGVPPPPEGSEIAIQRAMNGDEIDENNPDSWFVPVIVSEGRLDTDKAGKPSLVFDCVFHTSVKSRTLRDPEFKLFIIELSLQRIEAQTQLVLSRQIGTPNIAAKGKLQPRTVSIPSLLASPEAKTAEMDSKSRSMKKPLIEEILSNDPSGSTVKASLTVEKPKGILKGPSNETLPAARMATSAEAPKWSWSRSDSDRLQIQIQVPPVKKDIISLSNLDIEPRRLIFSIPDYPTLDLNLSLSDAELVARSGNGSSIITDLTDGGKDGNPTSKILTLKRQRPFNVENATAEWFMAENRLLVSV
ncbi:pre-RNA processing PIH1/Nop17-domain-containing protein [Rhodocollybia butyracea]|uniref:Pre-RNA processing PIH1/Nop17-domain-containing protein n=1 Tax=Rhodocollybia butyracea TaxID=206335 RepID=A0A9P5UCV6_9AGAR|nr:pre-RNA processing PIH1/Nop17-domain-containing protein [Rhodocollybia butyracea]